MKTNPFLERFQSYTASQLIEILNNKNSYQPLAVEAAQLELENRQLTEEEINIAKEEIQKKEQYEIQKQETSIKNKIKSIGFAAIAKINPLNTTQHIEGRFIKTICILLAIQWLYAVISQFSMLKFCITDNISNWDISLVLYLIPFVLIPTAIILFWLKKKLGWILLCAFLSYTAFSSIYNFIIHYKSPSTTFDIIFPKPSTFIQIILIFYFGGALIYLCKKPIRDTYMIEKHIMIRVIGIVYILTTIQWWEALT
ncbi:MAG TPA: hypothetical protein PKO16_02785 [Bacteroidia bacterium]|jgi:hypothetical protein|nr:hypothetical protein [Bacteroidia bacterium]